MNQKEIRAWAWLVVVVIALVALYGFLDDCLRYAYYVVRVWKGAL